MVEPSSTQPSTVATLPIPTVTLVSNLTNLHSAIQNLSSIAMILDTIPVTLTHYASEYFNIWKFQVQSIFRSRNLLDIVEGCELLDVIAPFATRQYCPPLLNVCSSQEMWIQLLLHYDKRAITNVYYLQKKLFDLKPTARKGIWIFLSEVNNVNDQLRELDIVKAFEEDALINKILSSLPAEFFYFDSTWDSTSEAKKPLNLSKRLIKEEEKFKHMA